MSLFPRALRPLALAGLATLLSTTATAQSLEEHTAEFEREVITVTEGVHVAVGFALANSILVEGDSCTFVVDVTESAQAASEIKAEFDKISDLPVKALIYTHNHTDHIMGGKSFVDDADIPVYAHETTNAYIDRVFNVIRPAITRRSARMFGTLLPADSNAFVNAGIGGGLRLRPDNTAYGMIRPNRFVSDRLETEICGVQVVMVHAPGETNDQIFVWLPERKALLPGDNIYKAFPNLYTIRGTSYRDVEQWFRSLDKMRALDVEHLVPSHTRPVSGQDQIMEILTVYRDGIQFVHDQSIRGINMGMTPDELAAHVKLPPHLAGHPYLQEYYGTVEFSVRSIYAGYLGWFNGDAATLQPQPPVQEAQAYIDLAGGLDSLLMKAEQANADGNPQWAAKLAGYALTVAPENSRAREIKAAALEARGAAEQNPNARNWYFTQAGELRGEITMPGRAAPDDAALDFAQTFPMENFMNAMRVNLDPEASAEAETTV
ncbi:MAG: alkyl/aryl-sulfatase, partial [Alphaproteobacteria bacterium]|nr:alkyl/aryl-sulfatase [Alphaproteobacteria bacterium]